MAELDCPSCSGEFATEQGLKTHYSRIHGGEYPAALTDQFVDDDYECPTCSNQFETEHGLKTHRAQVHGNSRPDARSLRFSEPGE